MKKITAVLNYTISLYLSTLRLTFLKGLILSNNCVIDFVSKIMTGRKYDTHAIALHAILIPLTEMIQK